VFRTGETLNEGKRKLSEVFASFSDVQVTDRSLVWNTDLIETLELDNLLVKPWPPCIRPKIARKAAARRRARTSRTAERSELDEAHPVLGQRPRRDAFRLPNRALEHLDR